MSMLLFSSSETTQSRKKLVKRIRYKLIKNAFKIYKSNIEERVKNEDNSKEFWNEAEVPDEDHVNTVLTEK